MSDDAGEGRVSSLIRKHICNSPFEFCEILFRKIRSHAILVDRLPDDGNPSPCSQKPSRLHVEPTAGEAGEASRRPRAGGCRRWPRLRGYGRTSHGPVRSPEMLGPRARRSGRSVRLATPAGRERKFSSLQTLENKRNRIGIPILPGVATPRPSSVSFAGNRGWRNFPIRNPLKRLETAKESRRPSLAFRGTPRPTPSARNKRLLRGERIDFEPIFSAGNYPRFLAATTASAGLPDNSAR
jgi:hypothetical protein